MKKDTEEKWKEIQDKIQNNIEEGFDDISEIFDNAETDTVVVFYFLMFWSRIMHRYGKNGEKQDNTNVIKLINNMMGGDLPTDAEKVFDRRANN
tara:strand:- start:309 stop:590 length:282 start_codon:yes stop_codon:yes gene_type:complete